VLCSESCSDGFGSTALLGMERWGTHPTRSSVEVLCVQKPRPPDQFGDGGTDHTWDSWFPLKESGNRNKTVLLFNFWRSLFTYENFHTRVEDLPRKWHAIILFALQFLLQQKRHRFSPFWLCFFDLFLLNNLMFLERMFYLMVLINN